MSIWQLMSKSNARLVIEEVAFIFWLLKGKANLESLVEMTAFLVI